MSSVVVYSAWFYGNVFFCLLYGSVCWYCYARPFLLMTYCMYSSSEMTGSMFDVAVLSRLVLRCGRCCLIYTTTIL
jgi:hypothetical protein